MRRTKSKRDSCSEFKFYTITDNARVAVLEALAREAVAICALSVYKGPQIIPHTPINYGILLSELLRRCGAEQECVVEIVVDTPFNTPRQRAQLTATVYHMLDLDVGLDYVDSLRNPYVQLADFVAGAVRAKHTGRDKILYQFIQPRVIGDQLIQWKTLRREWMEREWQE